MPRRAEIAEAMTDPTTVQQYLKDGIGMFNLNAKEMILKAAYFVAAADGEFQAEEQQPLYFFTEVKGAAGQAIENMNLMLGLPETAGLRLAAEPEELDRMEELLGAAGEAGEAGGGQVERRDGSRQVTYAGHPLYFYAHEDPWQVLCHDFVEYGGTWFVVQPDGDAAPPNA